jgi:hypothetical protein
MQLGKSPYKVPHLGFHFLNDVERQCLKSTGNETERDRNITTDILMSMSVMKKYKSGV